MSNAISSAINAIKRSNRSLDSKDYQIREDGSLLHSVYKTASGFSGEVRLYGHVIIDGKSYRYDRVVQVRLKRTWTPQEAE